MRRVREIIERVSEQEIGEISIRRQAVFQALKHKPEFHSQRRVNKFTRLTKNFGAGDDGFDPVLNIYNSWTTRIAVSTKYAQLKLLEQIDNGRENLNEIFEFVGIEMDLVRIKTDDDIHVAGLVVMDLTGSV